GWVPASTASRSSRPRTARRRRPTAPPAPIETYPAAPRGPPRRGTPSPGFGRPRLPGGSPGEPELRCTPGAHARPTAADGCSRPSSHAAALGPPVPGAVTWASVALTGRGAGVAGRVGDNGHCGHRRDRKAVRHKGGDHTLDV